MIQNNQIHNQVNINLNEISTRLEFQLKETFKQLLNQQNNELLCDNCKRHQIFSKQHLSLTIPTHQGGKYCSNTYRDPVQLCSRYSNCLTIKNRKYQ